MNLILLATAWGPKYGGINAFNEDFAVGLATYPALSSIRERKVFCLVPDCSEEQITRAKRDKVTLIPVPAAGGRDPFDDFPTAVLTDLAGLPEINENDIWVGHDLQTGAAAVAAARATNSKSALIFHYNPESYKNLQSTDRDAEQKHRSQRDLFKAADFCFAVGPSLRNALQSKLPSKTVVHMLVPGLQEISALTATDALRAIVFGRMDSKDDIIKQGLLAAAGYGEAVRRIRETPQIAHLDVMLKLFGVCSKKQEAKLKRVADEAAGRVAPLLALAPESDREEIHYALARSNLALVPSLHDGFSLAGWEAIAAETPLILSHQTGLWQLLKDITSPSIAEALVRVIDVKGVRGGRNDTHYTPEDVETIAKAIVDAVTDRHNRIRDAAFLKELLIRNRDGCTWHKTAEEFFIGIGELTQREASEYPFVGDWIGYFIEGPPVRRAKLIRERIEVRRDSNELRGRTSYVAQEGPREEEMSSLGVRLGVLNGHTTASSGYTQGSWCQFQLVRRCEGRLLDGVVSWSSTVLPAVDWSRYIWVEDKPGNEALVSFAEEEMELERQNVDRRFKYRNTRPYPGEPAQLTAYDLEEAEVGTTGP